ncbi:TonB-dependent siderophore receptor [uncultured Jannaschia sp.]|uniref:TonB-dependent receptor n=1 Tax=uncultured Jannaschia sp. TaxID=293347 RepID=UPI002621230E|nr:TonB-dependent siderophore receptor [uncultured Jannaschia sp.]
MNTKPPAMPRSTHACLLLAGSASCALLAAAAAAHAQTADDVVDLGTIFIDSVAGSTDGETIVVNQVSSGSGLPNDILESSASISVVTSKEIEDRGAETTEEVLQYTSGVATDYYGRDDRFDYFKIRGYDAYTYRDGLFIGENFGGVREEPFAFDRVEVLKGANSTAFGVADPGGAVNFITKSPTGERLRYVYGTVGSFERKEVGFDLGDNFGDSAFSWRLTGKAKDAEAETDDSNDDEGFLLGGLAWRPSDATTISLVYDKLYRDGYPNSSGYPANGDAFDRDLFLGEPGFNYLDTDRDTLTLKVEHEFGGGLEFGSTARWTDGTGGFGYVFLGATTSETDVSRFYFANDAAFENFVGDAHLLYRADLGGMQSRTLAGVEYRDNHRDNVLWYTPADDIDFTDPTYTGGLDLDETTPFQSTTNDTQVASVYLQQEVAWDRVIAQVGLRHDRIDAEQTDNLSGVETEGAFDETTARAGLTYRLTPNLSLYGSYAESAVPASAFGVEPERGKQLEAGVKYRPDAMRALFTASVYDLRKFNQTVTDADTLLPETIGESQVRGIDLEAKAELTDGLSVIAAYSYLDSEIVESDNGTNNGNSLGSVPRHSGALWIGYAVPGRGAIGDVDLGLGARYIGEYWTSDANIDEIESSWIVDAALGYGLTDTTEMRLNVSNLLDEQHVAQKGFSANYYNPGREVALTLSHTW